MSIRTEMYTDVEHRWRWRVFDVGDQIDRSTDSYPSRFACYRELRKLIAFGRALHCWSWERAGGVVQAALKIRLDETDDRLLAMATDRWGSSAIGGRCLMVQLAESLGRAQNDVPLGQPPDLSQTQTAWEHVCSVLADAGYDVSFIALDLEGLHTQDYWHLRSTGQLEEAGVEDFHDPDARNAYQIEIYTAYAAQLRECYIDTARGHWPEVTGSNYGYSDYLTPQANPRTGSRLCSPALIPGGPCSPSLYALNPEDNLGLIQACVGEPVPWLPPPGWTRSTATPTQQSKAQWRRTVQGLANRGIDRLLLWWPDSMVTEDDAAWGAQQIAEAYQMIDLSGYPNLVLEMQPVAYYRLDRPLAVGDTAIDEMGLHDGTVAGSALTLDEPGPLNRDDDPASGFDGAAYITVPSLVALANSMVWTWVGWLHATSDGTLIAAQDSAGYPHSVIALGINSQVGAGYPRLYTRSDSGQAVNFAYVGPAINDGAWHQLAAACDGSDFYLWVDGALNLSHPIKPDPYSFADFLIGNTPISGDFLTGGADEIAIFDRALSTDEITALYLTAQNGAP